MNPFHLAVSAWLCACAVALTLPPEPPLECSCEMSGEMSFSAAHFKNHSGVWNTEISVTRGACNSSESQTDIVALPIISTTRTPVAVPLTDLGYENFPGLGHYKLHLTGLTWDDARRRCQDEGTHLVVPNSEMEVVVLRELLGRHKTLPGTRSNDLVFLGLHDQYNEGQYLTIFGEPAAVTGFNEWGPNPDNAGGSGVNPGDDCVVFHRGTNKMTDDKCENVLAFFCESEERERTIPRGIDYSASAYDGLEKEVKPSAGTVRRVRPSPGYELFPGVGFYKFHTLSDTWENARRVCKQEGGHLAVINSMPEEQVLIDLFKRHQRLLRNIAHKDYVFIGFHDKFVEGRYQTVQGEPLQSVGHYRWATGEPTDPGLIAPGEDCGVMHITGGLADYVCSSMMAFICEQDLFI